MSDIPQWKSKHVLAEAAPKHAAVVILRLAATIADQAATILAVASMKNSVGKNPEATAEFEALRDKGQRIVLAIDDLVNELLGIEHEPDDEVSDG